MRRTATFRAAVITAALTTVLLGGCTSVVPGTPAADPRPAPTQGPGSDPVAWADKVCASMITFVKPSLAQPDFTGAADLPAIKKLLSDYLGSIVTGVQQGHTQLNAVGLSPVTGGDETVKRLTATITKLEQDMSTAKAKVDAADTNDPTAFQAALTDAQNVLKQITTPSGLGDLGSLPRLDKAAQAAVSCQQLAAMLPAS